MKLKVPFFRQDTDYTCGPTALQMVLKFMGDFESEKFLTKETQTSKNFGTSHEHMMEAARKEGFHSYDNHNSSIPEIKEFIKKGLPVIVNFIDQESGEGHYAVVCGFEKGKIILNDPLGVKNLKMGEQEFISNWHNAKNTSARWMMVIYKPGKTI